MGGFLAAWVIGYGMVQAAAPRILRGTAAGRRRALEPRSAGGFVLAACLGADRAPHRRRLAPERWRSWAASPLFGVVFAINSAVHSYLILAYTDCDKVALNVGFYYMANAGGRLLGTLLSGVMYLVSGLEGCLWTATVLALLATVLTFGLTSRQAAPSEADLART